MSECDDVSPHGSKDLGARVSAISVLMSEIWVISQMVMWGAHIELANKLSLCVVVSCIDQ